MNASPDHNIDPDSPKADGGPDSTIDVSELLRNFPTGVFMIINEAVFTISNVSVGANGDCPTMTGDVPGSGNVGWQRNEIEFPDGIRKS